MVIHAVSSGSHQITEKAINQEVAAWNHSNRPLISEAAAVTIAAWWQSPGGIGRVLASFASGCVVEKEDLLDDIDRTIAHDRPQSAELAALRAWVEAQ